MTTALFGGSFDPVHLGHKNAVTALLESGLGVDRVIIMPAYISPFKADSDTLARASGGQRLEMCSLTFGDIPRCEISDYELKKGGISYTVETLEHLREIYPDDRLILTVGSDSLESLPRWRRFEDIARLAEIAAVSRSEAESTRINGYSSEVSRLGGRVHIIDAAPFEISSTEIRKKIMNNCEFSCFVDKKVVEYIVVNAIYKGNEYKGNE